MMNKCQIKSIRRKFLSSIRLSKLIFLNSKFKIGKNYMLGKNCFISRKDTINISHNFYMGNYCHIAANALIGNDVLFASFVSLMGGDHKIDNITTSIRNAGTDEF